MNNKRSLRVSRVGVLNSLRAEIRILGPRGAELARVSLDEIDLDLLDIAITRAREAISNGQYYDLTLEAQS